MDKKTNKKIIKKKVRCPSCSLQACIEIRKFSRFVIYICPRCKNNIAYYGKDKVSIISDYMVASLKKQQKLEICGDALFPIILKEKGEITKDSILNLKILLETEKDFNNFLKQI